MIRPPVKEASLDDFTRIHFPGFFDAPADG